jgi:hypothetical protein
MATIVYFVLLHEKQWKINCGGAYLGTYDTREAAIRDAIDEAQKAGETNADGAEVRVLRTFNTEFRREWVYGKDPYPPTG